MKTLLFFIVTGVVVFFIFQNGSFLKSSYESELIGVGLNFPAKMLISADTGEYITISYPKPSTNQILIQRKNVSNLSSPLSFTLTRDFSSTVSNEQRASWGRDGIVFSWQSARGVEKAFAFIDGKYLYVVTTYGVDAKGQSVRDLEDISRSITLTH